MSSDTFTVTVFITGDDIDFCVDFTDLDAIPSLSIINVDYTGVNHYPKIERAFIHIRHHGKLSIIRLDKTRISVKGE